MNRNDFNMLDGNLIYFDNSATSLKPKCVVDKINDYNSKFSVNCHRGDYDLSKFVDCEYENVRNIVKDFINCDRSDEIIFTSGTTDSINRVVFSFMKYYLTKDDEVILTKTEHASNLLPWFILSEDIGFKIRYIDLINGMVTIDNVKKIINNNTKVISIASVTNTLGDVRPINEIGKLCRDNNIIFMVDGAQSVAHSITDVKKDNIDILCFSAHKMLGSTGCGVLYSRYDLLNKFKPFCYGGGMNVSFESDFSYELKELPLRLEAGTQNISGVLSLGEAIKYLNNIGMDKINKYELELKEYFINKLKSIDNVEIYNENTKSGIILFNIKGIFAEDTSQFLNKYNICVRAGNHCAKIAKEVIGVKNTCRASLYFYNTKSEIDKFIEVMKGNKDIFKVIL